MSMSLKKVSKLTITFLVDNTVEWMTKLPPGFTHELIQQVRELPIDEEKGVPIFNFNDFCCGAHGFAALLETEITHDGAQQQVPGSAESISQGTTAAKNLTLFDTGPDSMSLVRNIRALQVPITDIDRVVTSHWHADHTGGLLSFLKLRNECLEKGITTPERTSTIFTPEASVASNGSPSDVTASPCIVDVHPSRPLQRGIAPPPTHNVFCALPRDPSFEEITSLGAILEKRDEGHTVANGTIWISGEIPRITDFEGGLLGGVRWIEDDINLGDSEAGNTRTGNGRWVPEPHLMDERYAAVDVEGKGLVIFSSCSHAGIVNVVKDAVKTFKRPIYMIVGGLHLASSDLYPRIEPTVEFLSKILRPAPTYILPMHCTGWRAKLALDKELGEGVVPAGAGHRVEIQGMEERPEHMWVELSNLA